MPRFSRLLLPALAALACLGLPEAAPAIQVAPAFFTGDSGNAELWLLEDHCFVLAEGAGGGRRWLSGKWRELRNGRLLQLSNRQGFVRALNVGSAGDLYATGDDGRSRRLGSAPFTEPRPQLAGWLSAEGGVFLFEDSATGRTYRLTPGGAAARIDVGAGRVFAEVVLSRDGGSYALERVRSFSRRAPGGLGDAGISSEFQEFVRGRQLRCFPPELDGGRGPGLSVLFEPDAARSGRFLVAAGGIALDGFYDLDGDMVFLHPDGRRARDLAQLGLGSLADRLAGGWRWALEGALLVLERQGGDLALEPAAGP